MADLPRAALVGTAIWTAFVAGCGYVLSSNYARVERWMDPITYAALAPMRALALPSRDMERS